MFTSKVLQEIAGGYVQAPRQLHEHGGRKGGLARFVLMNLLKADAATLRNLSQGETQFAPAVRQALANQSIDLFWRHTAVPSRGWAPAARKSHATGGAPHSGDGLTAG